MQSKEVMAHYVLVDKINILCLRLEYSVRTWRGTIVGLGSKSLDASNNTSIIDQNLECTGQREVSQKAEYV